MTIIYLAKFEKDVDKITSQAVKNDILQAITAVREASKLSEIKNLKKLTGYKNAYRLKIGTYRIGLLFEDNTVIFARVVARKDIYNVFP
jgi:mRNA interferase RelE/StbE